MPTSGGYNQGGTGGIGAGLGAEQPDDPGFWMNNGVLTFWNGTTNNIMDFNEGTVTDVFGAIVIGDQ